MKTKLLSLVAILLLCLSISYGQSIEYDNSMFWTDNKDLIVDGDYAYCSYAYGILILDISSPAEPTFVSRVFMEGYTNGLAKSGDLLLACVNGLTIYNVSDPYSPVYLGNFFNDFDYFRVFTYDNYAFSSRFIYDEIDYGLDIIDFSNPEEPLLAGIYSANDGIIDMSFSDSIACYTTSDGFTILDISEPTSPEFISEVYITGYVFDIAVENSLAYITFFNYYYNNGGLVEFGGVIIYDVSDPENPISLGNEIIDWWRPHELIVEYPYAYVSSDNGFKILDISDPANPSELSCYSGFGRNALIDKQTNYCYVAAEDSISIQIVDVSDVNEPVLAGSYGFDYGRIYTCKMSGDKLYLQVMDGLPIINISDPSSPVIEDFIDMFVYSYNIYDSIAYVSGQGEGISFYNIIDPSNPILIGNFDSELIDCNWAYHITVTNDILYGITRNYLGDKEIFFADISDLSNPIFRGTYNPGSRYLYEFCVVDSILFCSGYQGNLHIVSLSNPWNPQLMSITDTPGRCRHIEIDGNFGYIADYDSGLTVLDISDLYNPVVISQLETGGRFNSFVPTGDLLIGFNDETDYPNPTDIFIIDISDPYNPAIIVSRDVYGLIGDILCKDNYIFICAFFGLLIYEYDIETGLKEVATIPSSLSLSQNYPNPFNATTIIQYNLPIASDVTIDIYNLLGRRISTIVDEYQTAGYKSVIWNSRNSKGDAVSSGIYFYRLTTSEISFTKQMTLIK